MITNGIVLIENVPFRLEISASLFSGRGRIGIHGLVESSIEAPIAAGIAAADRVSDFLERPSAGLSTHNLHFTISVPASPDSPIIGTSFHLALAVSTMLLLCRMQAPQDSVFTGGCDEGGDTLPIDAATAKRAGAKMLGFRRIVLPTRNFDFFSGDIIQSPVRNLYEVFALLGDVNA